METDLNLKTELTPTPNERKGKRREEKGSEGNELKRIHVTVARTGFIETHGADWAIACGPATSFAGRPHRPALGTYTPSAAAAALQVSACRRLWSIQGYLPAAACSAEQRRLRTCARRRDVAWQIAAKRMRLNQLVLRVLSLSLSLPAAGVGRLHSG